MAMDMKKWMMMFDWLAVILAIIGSLNWGLVGFGMLFLNMDLNLVEMLFGRWPILVGIIYLLVGVSGIWIAIYGAAEKFKGFVGGP